MYLVRPSRDAETLGAPAPHQECTAQPRPSVPQACLWLRGKPLPGPPRPFTLQLMASLHVTKHGTLPQPEQLLPSLRRPSSPCLFHPLLPPHVRPAGVQYSWGHGHLVVEGLSTLAPPKPCPLLSTLGTGGMTNSVTLPTSFLGKSSVATNPPSRYHTPTAQTQAPNTAREGPAMPKITVP